MNRDPFAFEPGRETHLQHGCVFALHLLTTKETAPAFCIRAAFTKACAKAWSTAATKRIPTVNGSIVFDERFLGKPLVYYASTAGIMPAKINSKPTHEKSNRVTSSSWRAAIGKDGIHGATFSRKNFTKARRLRPCRSATRSRKRK